MAHSISSAARAVLRDLGAFLIGLCLPVLFVAASYDALVGYRHDYLGHFLAGCGATLFVSASVVWVIDREHFARFAPVAIVLLALAAIGVGAYFEATIYRLAKFDEVDFCNQSLGAVMAALGLLALFRPPAPSAKPSPLAFAATLLFAILVLRAGYHYAFL